eukprot:GEMP01019877.1.p1 GENE.GEMP01019877.1~~GEMP01019877.1.p1  ORF type:complete len:515 (+),score=55.52 GEMP01019877.1:19-1563(+)
MYTFWTTPVTQGCPGPRAAHSCDVIDMKLYVFGGWNGKKALNDLHVLNVATSIWTQLQSAEPPSARNNHSTAVIDHKLLVYGGHDGNKWLQDMYLLDTASTDDPRWQRGVTSGNAPAARACHTLSRLGWKLYMFGGYDGTKCFNDMDILDLETMTWMHPTLSGQPPQARNAHTMTVIGANLYLFGGHSGNKHLTDLHLFDTSKLLWSQPDIQGTPPPGLRGHTATLIGHKILLFGGYDGKGRTNELYILDAQERKWIRPTWPSDSPQTPPGRQRHTACLIGSKRIYIFGGFDGNKWLQDLHLLDVGRMEENDLETSSVNTLIQNLNKLLRDPEFADVCFVVSEKKIYAHKAILVAQCAHFRAMFGTNMRESREKEIHIEGWSDTAFLALLEWIYTGRVPQGLAVNYMTEVLGLADQYTLDPLKHVCENILVHDVEVDNVCMLLRVADRTLAHFLKRHCMNYLLKHFESVANTPAFEELRDVPPLLLEVTRASATLHQAPSLGYTSVTVAPGGSS